MRPAAIAGARIGRAATRVRWPGGIGALAILALLALPGPTRADPPAMAAGGLIDTLPAQPTPCPSYDLDLALDGGCLTIAAIGAPIRVVLDEITRLTGIRFVVPDDLDGTVDGSVRGCPVEEAIGQVLGDHGHLAHYEVVDGRPVLAEIRVLSANAPAAAASPRPDPAEDAADLAMHRAAILDLDRLAPVNLLYEEVAALSPRDRRLAMDWLADEHPEDAVPALARFLALDAAMPVRSEAAIALGRLSGDPALAALTLGLGDREPDVRFHATLGIGQEDREGAVPLLGQVLFADPDRQVRMVAVEALARQRDDAALALIEAAAEDADPDVRALARDALAFRD